jgi:hypothetical protein
MGFDCTTVKMVNITCCENDHVVLLDISKAMNATPAICVAVSHKTWIGKWQESQRTQLQQYTSARELVKL